MEEQLKPSTSHIPMKPTTIPVDIVQETVIESNTPVTDSVVSPIEDATGIRLPKITNSDAAAIDSVVSPIVDATRIGHAKDNEIRNKPLSLNKLFEITQQVNELKNRFISLEKATEKGQTAPFPKNNQESPQPETDTNTKLKKQHFHTKSSPYPGRHARKNFLRRQRVQDRRNKMTNLHISIQDNHRQVVFRDKDKLQSRGDCDDHSRNALTQPTE